MVAEGRGGVGRGGSARFGDWLHVPQILSMLAGRELAVSVTWRAGKRSIKITVGVDTHGHK